MIDARKDETIGVKSQGNSTKEYDLEDDDTSNDIIQIMMEIQLGMEKTLVITLMN